MNEAAEREYRELKAFFHAVAPALFPTSPDLRPEHHPIAVLEAYEKRSRRMAFIGLRQAVNDCVEAFVDLKPADVIKLDEALRHDGIITLSEIRRRYTSVYKRILKRKKIKSETEFYLVQGLLADLESAITSEERELLGNLVMGYESNR